jgi:uncharacterized membrane protein
MATEISKKELERYMKEQTRTKSIAFKIGTFLGTATAVLVYAAIFTVAVTVIIFCVRYLFK